jgi:hypothetical protein
LGVAETHQELVKNGIVQNFIMNQMLAAVPEVLKAATVLECEPDSTFPLQVVVIG